MSEAGHTRIDEQAQRRKRDAVRPFRINIPEADLADLRRRIEATRWPDRETVSDGSQGVPLATLQDLARHWATDYDWRKCEAKLNALPQFVTEIDGLDIHFIHVRSKHRDALPLIVTHGWPGSVIELLDIIDPLTNPTAHGASASDAFHLVIPSLPGFGFSGKPTSFGWDPHRIARAWVVLMKRLGYERFAAQGGDWGAIVCDAMARTAPPGLIGIHTNMPETAPPEIIAALQRGAPPPAGLSADEKRAYERLQAFFTNYVAYAVMMGKRPQTLCALADSPMGLAGWILDGHPPNELEILKAKRDAMLDNITLYWLTNTAISAARIYWENKIVFFSAANVELPAAVSVFPGDVYQAPRSWTERAYRKLIHFNTLDRGGHFAAWGEPELFVNEVRVGLRSLRAS
jgi:pimeloyl-ACP methyl ester carboxylesterase